MSGVAHVAIVRKPNLELILSGEKDMELRLTRRAVPPWGALRGGEVIHLKQSGGAYRAVAIAGMVEAVRLADAAALRRLRDRVEARVRGGEAFWAAKAGARYATLISLVDVRPTDSGPSLAHLGPGARRAAWHVLGAAETSPARTL